MSEGAVYMESMERSVEYFLSICRDRKEFPPEFYDRSIETNRFILTLDSAQK